MLQAAPGLTGPRASLDPANAGRIASLRASGVAAPILLGFGVSNGEQARAAVGLGADGVVVGSAALRAALAGRAELAALLKDLRTGARWLNVRPFLGFDVGTTAIKGALFDFEGRLVAHAARPYPTSRPAPGIAEQDPRDWTDGVVETMDALLIGDRAERVAAVGLCGQANTDVFVGATARRSRRQSPGRTIARRRKPPLSTQGVTDEDKIAWWGAPLPIGASHVLARMTWMARARPEVFAATRHVLTPKDYCLRALVGEAVADPMSNFFVVGLDLAYVDPLISRVEGARERLPALKFFTDIVGEIPLGSSGRRAPVVAGTMDAWSGLFGAGVRQRRARRVHQRHQRDPGDRERPAHRCARHRHLPHRRRAHSERRADPERRRFAAMVGRRDRTRRRRASWLWRLKPIVTAGRSCSCRISKASARLCGTHNCAGRSSASTAARADADHALAVHGGRGAVGAGCCARPAMRRRANRRRACFTPAAERAPISGRRSRPTALGGRWIASPVSTSAAWARRSWRRSAIGAYPSLAEAISAMTHVERSFEPDPRMRARYDAMYDAYSRATQALRPLEVIGASEATSGA